MLACPTTPERVSPQVYPFFLEWVPMIKRAPRPQANFYVLSKSISEDKRLSWAARGLLVYLLGKPDNWQVSVQALVDEVADSAKPTRRDGTYALVDELIECGYITRTANRGSDGRMHGYIYQVSECSDSISGSAGYGESDPVPAKPYTDEPYPVETTLIRTDKKQELSGNKDNADPSGSAAQRKRSASSSAHPKPESVSDSVWSDWLTLRKSKKAPVTATAIAAIQAESVKAGVTLQDALEVCCARGWTGFKADWVRDSQPRQAVRQPSQPAVPASDRNAEALRMLRGMSGQFQGNQEVIDV